MKYNEKCIQDFCIDEIDNEVKRLEIVKMMVKTVKCEECSSSS